MFDRCAQQYWTVCERESWAIVVTQPVSTCLAVTSASPSPRPSTPLRPHPPLFPCQAHGATSSKVKRTVSATDTAIVVRSVNISHTVDTILLFLTDRKSHTKSKISFRIMAFDNVKNYKQPTLYDNTAVSVLLFAETIISTSSTSQFAHYKQQMRISSCCVLITLNAH